MEILRFWSISSPSHTWNPICFLLISCFQLYLASPDMRMRDPGLNKTSTASSPSPCSAGLNRITQGDSRETIAIPSSKRSRSTCAQIPCKETWDFDLMSIYDWLFHLTVQLSLSLSLEVWSCNAPRTHNKLLPYWFLLAFASKGSSIKLLILVLQETITRCYLLVLLVKKWKYRTSPGWYKLTMSWSNRGSLQSKSAGNTGRSTDSTDSSMRSDSSVAHEGRSPNLIAFQTKKKKDINFNFF